MTAPLHLDLAGSVDEPKHAIRARHVVVDGTWIPLAERLRQRQRSKWSRSHIGDLEFRLGCGPQREFTVRAGLRALLQGIQITGDNVGRIQFVLYQSDERWRQ